MVMWGAVADVEGITFFALGLLALGVPVGWAWRALGRRCAATSGAPPVAGSDGSGAS